MGVEEASLGTDHALHLRAAFAVIAVVVSGYGLMQTLVIPVLPTIRAGLHTTQNTATWIITVYLLSASVATPIMGRLGDMFGKDRVLIAAVGALVVGSLMGALADRAPLMLVARAVQGIGGGVFPLAFGIVRDHFPRKRVATVVGTVSAVAAAAGGLGIVIGGPIVDALGFHWLFWLPMIVLSGGAVAAYLFIPKSPEKVGGRVNVPAAILLSTWLLALLLGISEAPTWGWGSPRVVGLLVAAAAVAVAWVTVESRSTYPLIDMHLMRLRAVWSTNVVACLLGAALYAPFAFLPEFLETPRSVGYGFGVSVSVTGLVLLPETVLSFFLGLWSGRLSARFGAKQVLAAGLACCMVSFIVLPLGLGSLWAVVVAMALNGIGVGAAFACMSSLVVQSVPMESTGVASGMNANIRAIGGALGTAVMSSIVTAGVHNGELPHEHGYFDGFLAIAFSTAIATAVCIAIPRTSRSRQSVSEALGLALATTEGD